MKENIDSINYRYAFIRHMILWYLGLTMIFVAIFRWEFDAFLFVAFGFFAFNAILSQPIYTELSLSKKLKNDLIRFYVIDFSITLVSLVFLFPLFILKIFSFLWICSISIGHEVKGGFQ